MKARIGFYAMALAMIASQPAVSRAPPGACLPTATLYMGGAVTVAGQDLTAKSNEPLVVQAFHTAGAVQLMDSAEKYGAIGKERLAPGKILLAVESSVGLIYCTPGRYGVWEAPYGREYCFRDDDGDGIFDVSIKSGVLNNWTTEVTPIGDDGQIHQIEIFPATPLTEPIRYSVVAPDAGQAGKYVLKWKTYRDAATKTNRITVWSAVGGWGLSDITDGYIYYNLDDQFRGHVSYRGSEIEILGKAEDGSLKYRLEKAFPARRFRYFVPQNDWATGRGLRVSCPGVQSGAF